MKVATIVQALTLFAVFGIAGAQPPNNNPPLGPTTAYGDPAQVMDSSEALVGALDSIFDFTAAQYVPGYGLQINASYSGSDAISPTFTDRTGEILTALSPLVTGLGEGDMVSISYSLSDYDQTLYFTLALEPGNLESYRGFVNGVRQ